MSYQSEIDQPAFTPIRTAHHLEIAQVKRILHQHPHIHAQEYPATGCPIEACLVILRRRIGMLNRHRFELRLCLRPTRHA